MGGSEKGYELPDVQLMGLAKGIEKKIVDARIAFLFFLL
jgi:hypothetical protein